MEGDGAMARRLSLGCVIAVGAVWAACLVIGGLWFVFDLSRAIPPAGWGVVVVGLGFIAAGEFVFLALVADKLFPRMGRRMGAWAVQMALFGVFLVSITCAVVAVSAYWSAPS